ncbi:MAG: hypothetical protein IPL53_15220 [Ignavibacteria bacterium]|nr:hypothetical protein [Ignavibacteria bacterium]
MKTLFTIFYILFANFSFSQNLIQQFDGINFNVNGVISSAPFNGGMNNARYQFIDMDGDNDLDLFTFDADTSYFIMKIQVQFKMQIIN